MSQASQELPEDRNTAKHGSAEGTDFENGKGSK